MAKRDPDSTFAAALERLMHARGISQAKLAAELGTYDANVARWRKGRGITFENAQAIADYFGVDRAYMTRLAGYPDNSVSITDDTIDPEIAAMADAEHAEMIRRLTERGYPKAFWAPVMRAWRQMMDVVDATMDTISTAESGELEEAPDTPSEKEKRARRGRRNRLDAYYPVPA